MDRVAAFFYGLYMDAEVLARFGVVPNRLQQASLDGYRIQIGQKATLVADSEATVHGILADLQHHELETLYATGDLSAYYQIQVLATVEGSGHIHAVCYIAEEDQAPRNREYAFDLAQLARKLSLPASYCREIEALT
jgi:hypothetical protein